MPNDIDAVVADFCIAREAFIEIGSSFSIGDVLRLLKKSLIFLQTQRARCVKVLLNAMVML